VCVLSCVRGVCDAVHGTRVGRGNAQDPEQRADTVEAEGAHGTPIGTTSGEPNPRAA
jgi:hypothetical protein